MEDVQRIRVQTRKKSFFAFLGVFLREETIIHTELCFLCVRSREPMDGGFDLSSILRVAAAGGWVVGGVHFDDLARIILDDVRTLDEIGVAQPDFIARIKTIVFWRRR